MELPQSLLSAVMNWSQLSKNIFFSLPDIFLGLMPLTSSIQNSYSFRCNLTSNITSALLLIFLILPGAHTSFATKIIINFIALIIMQETCNTCIMAGVAASSNVGLPGNASATDAQKLGKFQSNLMKGDLLFQVNRVATHCL